MATAITPTRAENFPEWYQRVVADADLAVNSPVRGCMIIRPNGYGLWQRIQHLLNQRIEETGHENLYFPLFIPLSFMAREAQHVEGFAKEMAVVTHHRLRSIDGELAADPDSKLAEPLVIRPTSETIIGHHFRETVRSYRDLPLLWNQWANVVRWEMRTRLFLRTTEFLWQEGHTAHADEADARAETMRMLEVYRSFAEDVLAMPVIAGEKPAHERFPGAENTFSIEGMMQDGKALQAGTSHYLGTHFAEAQDIKFQNKDGDWAFCHTTSWGVSTRLIGGVVMSHGDDDGLRAPPRIAPRQIVIVPLLRGKPEDSGIIEYCEALGAALRQQSYAGEAIRAFVDRRDERAVEKRWVWIKRGAPIICEIGGRERQDGKVTYYRRDKLREGERLSSHSASRIGFISEARRILKEIHDSLFAAAQKRLNDNILTGVTTVDAMRDYFGAAGEEEEASPFRGWVRVPWKRPDHAGLARLDALLKELKLSVRNAPLGQGAPSGRCVFSGAPADEEVLVGRAY